MVRRSSIRLRAPSASHSRSGRRLALILSAALLGACPSEETPPRADAGAPGSRIAGGGPGEAARSPREVDWSGGDTARGRALYGDHCALCHGAGGRGDGLAAASLNPKPRDFTDGTFYFDADGDDVTGEAVDLARVIRDGPAAYGGSMSMAAFGEALSTTEIRDVAAYVRSLSLGSPD